MIRIRWFDPEPDNPPAAGWWATSLVIATLFLNFPFWYEHGFDLPLVWTLPVYALIAGASALVFTAAFFLGPAMAAGRAGRPLTGVITDSLGLIPAYGIHICCATFLMIWMAELVAMPSRWMLPFIERDPFKTVPLRETNTIAACILAFLFFTGLQSLRMQARLALFTNRLAVAILIAALIRVREAWPRVPRGFGFNPEYPFWFSIWICLSHLAYYVAPVAFLASILGRRNQGPRDVRKTALFGVAVPMFAAVVVVAIICLGDMYTFRRPSVPPNIAGALWGGASARTVAWRLLVVSLTIFGPVRFGAKALTEFVPMRSLGSRWRLVVVACLIGGIVAISARLVAGIDPLVFEMSARVLVAAAAVVTADSVAARWRVVSARRVDLTGVVAVTAALLTPWLMPYRMADFGADQWWHPWILPSYGIGFVTCLLGRAIERTRRSAIRLLSAER